MNSQPHCNSLLEADIEVLGLSVRATNVLRRNDLHTVGELTRVSERTLFGMTRLGRNIVVQIASSVERQGLRLAD
ncbi:DNA-directed RNA polymerase subunit alpha C-terminal domain-containing protein [Variovorax sp. OV329]|uniref:DNA-directed RNA polymerase subunit alpha C-terminal domain-containing protein n=1 Tax=Variovorax sp. OV329 TaxID=1882825 RepID=UPI0008EA1206|nr:DNA-directed RNA polymerase subunit alpha C-terminal domain-containing protein [Variovorax sp. OV329]SFM69334.1 RNA polymerase, alpha chain C terminal domain [Variovorax sp. OV329]